jgi:hypothetical protein
MWEMYLENEDLSAFQAKNFESLENKYFEFYKEIDEQPTITNIVQYNEQGGEVCVCDENEIKLTQFFLEKKIKNWKKGNKIESEGLRLAQEEIENA